MASHVLFSGLRDAHELIRRLPYHNGVVVILLKYDVGDEDDHDARVLGQTWRIHGWLVRRVSPSEVKAKDNIMRSDTGPSWLIRDDEAYLLQLALYVRDACQFLVAMHPSIPPLQSPVAPISSELATLNTIAAAEQWNAWWQELLQRLLTDTKTGDLNAAYAFPDFAALANRPDLQASVRLCFRQAVGWINSRMRELTPSILSANQAVRAQEIVRELEHERGRPVNAFRLRVISLPVQGKHAWSMTPSSAIMSYEFRFDAELYRNWLRAAVAALAF